MALQTPFSLVLIEPSGIMTTAKLCKANLIVMFGETQQLHSSKKLRKKEPPCLCNVTSSIGALRQPMWCAALGWDAALPPRAWIAMCSSSRIQERQSAVFQNRISISVCASWGSFSLREKPKNKVKNPIKIGRGVLVVPNRCFSMQCGIWHSSCLG